MVSALFVFELQDTDNNGEPDYRGADSDGDGIPNIVECDALYLNGDGQADQLVATAAIPDGD